MTIYFIRAGRNVKIGYTAGDPMNRLRALQTGNARRLVLLAAIPGGLEDEARIHRMFDASRVTGEWFIYGREIRALLKSLEGWTLDVPTQDERFLAELPHCFPDIHRGVNVWGFSCEEIAELAVTIAARIRDGQPERAAVLAAWTPEYVHEQLCAFGIPVKQYLFWDAPATFYHAEGTPQVLKAGVCLDDVEEFFRVERRESV